MATGQYIGVNGVARKVTTPYVGVNGVARKVVDGYVGVSGIARRFFEQGKPVILEVEKLTSNTYVNSTTYENEEFILLDIYPKTGGTVNVTYGGLTKTITDTSGAEEPNAQKVFFGTFYGESDSVTTPTSGTLTITGDYEGFAVGSYRKVSSDKSDNNYCSCITAATDISSIVKLSNNAFRGCTALKTIDLPDSITSISDNAFHSCTNLALTSLPSGVTSIDDYVFYACSKIALTSLPSGVTSIGQHAFFMIRDNNDDIDTAMTTITIPASVESIGNYAFSASSVSGGSADRTCVTQVTILSTTPPVLGTAGFGMQSSKPKIIVPAGCGATYKTAEGWSDYPERIVEAT